MVVCGRFPRSLGELLLSGFSLFSNDGGAVEKRSSAGRPAGWWIISIWRRLCRRRSPGRPPQRSPVPLAARRRCCSCPSRSSVWREETRVRVHEEDANIKRQTCKYIYISLRHTDCEVRLCCFSSLTRRRSLRCEADCCQARVLSTLSCV